MKGYVVVNAKGYTLNNVNGSYKGFLYEIGKTYEMQEEPICRVRGFHFYANLVVYLSYCDIYKVVEIEALGDIDEENNEYCTNKIKIVREISWSEVLEMVNIGECCTGSHNSGWRNSGDFNKCDNSAGFFCTEEPKAIVFNIETDMTVSEFRESKYMKAMKSSDFKLTEWILYTKEEMAEDENKKAVGGYLKKYTRKEAYANWWENMTDENKEIIMSIPNFDKDIFKEITGIDVEECG